MYDVRCRCDFCGKELSDDEFLHQQLSGKSATKETNLSMFIVCEKCASKIDNAILRFKLSMSDVIGNKL